MDPTSLLATISAPVTALFQGAKEVINHAVVTDKDRAEAEQKLESLKQDFTFKLSALLIQEEATRADVIKAEAGSQSWLTRNWRPMVMSSFGLIIFYNYFLALMFGLYRTEIPGQMWELLTVGIGGYTALRSFEKIAPGITKAITHHATVKATMAVGPKK